MEVSADAWGEAWAGYVYYESEQPGLGDRFFDDVEETLSRTRRHPQHYSFIGSQRHYRDVGLRHFPYVLIYAIEDGEPIVYFLHNTHQRPKDLP